MAYIRSRWLSLDERYIIEKKYHSWKCQAKKENRQRLPKEKITSTWQMKINARHRIEKFVRLALDNFRVGDSYLTATFSQDMDPEEVKKEVEKFKRRLRRIFKKRGQEFKHISVIENNGTHRGRPHVHLLVPAIGAQDIAAVEEAWPHGHVKFAMYKGKLSDAQKLMAYFCKEEVNRLTGSGRVMTSKNLVRNPPSRKVVSRSDTYRDVIKPPKGYEVVESLTRVTYTRDGYPLQIAVYERKDTGGNKSGARDGCGTVGKAAR